MSRRKKVNYAEDSDSNELEDFSASEDEWQPNQQKESTEAESDASDADFDAETTAKFGRRSSLAKRSRPSSSASGGKSSGKPKRPISSLRRRMLKKYNPTPRLTNTPAKPISKDIKRILEQSQYQRRKSFASSHDSDSSGDDYLVKRNELDLKSSFFDVTECSKPIQSENKVPEFDCNAGVKLSDSEDEEEEMEEVNPNKLLIDEKEESTEDLDDKKKSSRLIAGINQNSMGQIDFHQLVKYNKDAQAAEEKLKSIKGTTFKNDESLNVSKLLALGEGVSSSTFDSHHCQNTQESKGKGTKKRKKAARDGASDSDTDWEQVQEESHLDIKDELQINIPLATKSVEERKKSSQDVEMMIKRKLNRDMKEYQLYLHKVSLICHIAHGLYCNRVLNSPTLMAAALKLLPNKSCYPDGITCIKYFESIAKWYKQAIPIRKNQMYLGTRKRPKLGVSLALQIKYKEALCKKDFVLIFIILLRAMGFPCRLVINLTPISIRPPQDKLHSLSTKLKDEKKSGQKEKKIESKEIKKEKPQTKKKVQKMDEDHDYCISLKSKDKSKKSESQSKKKNESKEKEKKLHEDDKKLKPGGSKDSEQNTSKIPQNRRSNTTKEGTTNIKVSASPKEIKAATRASQPAKKDLKGSTSTAVKEIKTIDGGNEDGPSVSKRAKKRSSDNDQATNKITVAGSSCTQAPKNERKILSLSEKLKKRSTNGDEPGTQINVEDPRNSPPTLEKVNLENVNTNYRNAPLLSPKVKSDNTAVTSENKSNEESLTSPKQISPIPGNVSEQGSKTLAESPPHELPCKESPKPNLSAKLNKRGRKKISVTNEKSEPELAQGKAEQENERAPLVTSTVPKAKGVSSEQDEEIIRSDAVLEDATHSPATLQFRPKPSTRSKKSAPEILEPIENPKEPESAETEPFKEIKKNAGRKRTRASPQPKIIANSARNAKPEAKVESLHFRVPVGRTTRSQAKQQQTTENLTIPQLDGADDGRTASKKGGSKSQKPHYSDDDDFAPVPTKKPRPSTSSASKEKGNKNRKVLSSSSEEEDLNKKKMDVWVEVYSEKEEKWVTINLFKSQVNKPDELRKSATNPVAYVFAWNNDNTMKDVSPRYCPLWNTATRKQRVEKEWLEDAIGDYLERKTIRSKAEDVELHQMHIEKPLPTSISEYKNHPLYALQRHLLKFEAIYPPDALTLGFVRGEPVYSRDCVHTLHSRETWLRSARVVKPRETPYKIVKARPKWDRATQSVITDIPLEIFGKWQTMDYDPPTAENGRVPRNAYGNVDLFKPTMLPKKTVHLDLPGLQKVCKKLKIDCAQAVVGFDFHQGACHPIIQGYVVCEEFQDTVIDAWNRLQEEAERKEDEKYYARVYGNWKKLYRGLLIRERLKRKYNFKTLKIDDGKPMKKKKS